MSKTGLNKKPPPIREMYRWLGKLGGFIGRKGDSNPGGTATWRGWMRFSDLIEDRKSLDFYG